MRLAVAAALALASAAARAQAPGAQPPSQGASPVGSPPPAATAPAQPSPPAQAAPPADAGQERSTPPEQPGAAAPATPGAHSARKPPAAASDLARALLSSEQWGKILDSYASSLSGQVSQALLASGEKVPDDLRPRIRAELEKSLPYRQTVDAQAEALARQLTPDELRRTATFYKSPLGKKVLDRLPEAQSTVAKQLQGRLASAVPDIVNRIAPKALQGSPHGAPAPGAGGPSSPPSAQGRRPPSTSGSGSSGGASTQ